MAKGNHVSNFSNAQQPQLEPGQMGKMISAMEELRQLPKINYDNPDELRERINQYFEWTIEKDMRPGIEMLALAIGVDRTTLWRWNCNGGTKGQIIGQARQVIAALMEQWGLTGKINPTTLCFVMKNHFGYADEFTLKAVQENKLDSLPTKEEVVKRLGTLAPGEIEPDIEDML